MTMSAETSIDVRRAAQRFHTRLDWLDSWHSFSFGEHHDPANTAHGLVLVSNDDTVAPAAGFGPHSHRDSAGNHDVIRPGLAQRMSAGRGITHSETNTSRDEPVHFVQMWVLPDARGIEPGYEQRDVSAALSVPELVAVASGRGHDGAVGLHQRDAVLWAARLGAGDAVTIPEAHHVHLFVARGEANLERAGELSTGDAVRLTDAGALTLVAGPSGAETLVWETG